MAAQVDWADGGSSVPPDSPEPASTDGDRSLEAYKWWARDVAASLQHAIAEDVKVPKGKGSTEQVTISVLTRRIARQVAMQIPKETFDSLIGEAREKMKVVEESCLDQLYSYDEDDEEDDITESPEGANKDSSSGSSTTGQEMAEILTRRIPQEMSKWIAKEIFSQLMAAGAEDSSSTEDDLEEDDDLDETAWRGAAASFDIRPDEPAHGGGGGGGAASNDSTNDSEWTSPSALSETEGGAAAAVGAEGGGEKRIYLTDDATQREEAFKKFKLVLARGNGFRVIKHNHGGGRKTRVLKYNSAKNRIYWESSRVLGGERVSCSRIVKIHREATVVYVWHMTGGRHGSVKKMVGFETQREADARILELALLHLKDHGSHSKKA